MPLSLDRDHWPYRGAINVVKPELCKPSTLRITFSSQIFEIEATARPTAKRVVRASWRWAARLTPISNGKRFAFKWAPLTKKTIIVVKTFGTPYQLEAEALPWLPNLQVRIWEYTGPIPQRGDIEYDDMGLDDALTGQEDYGNVTDAGYV